MSRPATAKVTISGVEFSFKTEDPEYIKEIASYIDAEIQKVVATGKVSSQTKAVILAAFTITDELLRLRKEKETLSRRVDSMLDLANNTP
jgi:cell division protein ZapA (FtsZ GTPase activity inhibitor)